MSILCGMFGHKTPESYSEYSGMGGGDYLSRRGWFEDGVGRIHVELYGKCPRCGNEYRVGRIHWPKLDKEARPNQ